MSEEHRMNRRTEGYMLSHDIDWYFNYKGYIFHCASNGGIIPQACRKITYQNLIRRAIKEMTLSLNNEDLYINKDYVNRVVTRQQEKWEEICESTPRLAALFNPELVRELYLSSFIVKAKKGLIAWDRINNGGEESFKRDSQDTYVVVAAPQKDLLETRVKDSAYQTTLGLLTNMSNCIKIQDRTFTINTI